MGFLYVQGQKVHIKNLEYFSFKSNELNINIKDCSFGEGVVLWGNVNIYGCKIGANTKIANFVEIRSGVNIGTNCKIEPFVFIPEGVNINDNVFIGPNVTFTNDLFPRACDESGNIKNSYEITNTYISKGASIGANSVILCGVNIGENAMIGVGSTITKDIKDDELWYGDSAEFKRSL